MRAFPKDPVYIVLAEVEPNPGEVSWDTLERKVGTYEEGSLGHHPKFSSNKVNRIGEKQEAKTEIKSYTLTEIQTFLENFMQKERGEPVGSCGFSGVCGIGSAL